MGHTQQVCVRIVLLPSNVWQQGELLLRQQETDLPPAELWCACYFADRTIYLSSAGVVLLTRHPPVSSTTHSVLLNDFHSRETTTLITLKKNGKNERVNESFVTRLKCKVNASSTKIPWTKLLDQVCNEYNSTPHSITKYPPANLLFGLLPYQSHIDQNTYYEPVDEAREMALQRTIDYHIKNKIRYDARCIEKKSNPGDHVVYGEFQYPNTRKLSSPFSGSYEIIKQCSKVTYEINKPNSLAKKDSQIVHISKLS
ncbi:transposon Tf2-11 polyprotein [Trichonephila clavipes]|nr:transposon Tf2-11 polyprotein [Trichonephila clavipes]